MAGWTERDDGTPIIYEVKKIPKGKEGISEDHRIRVAILTS
jgi:hypothetical protein